MHRTAEQLRDDVLRIWRAGVEAVDSARLVRSTVRVEGSILHVDDETIDLASVGRIAVVGAGKAGAGMAAGLEEALGPRVLTDKQITGWLNVPADCVRSLSHIHLHAARPAGVNEPTAEGVAGAEEILRLVGSLGPNDLCLCLISGGASALLPAPAEGISLADKLAVTRHLSGAGANIAELNTVRKQLSRIKGGGLLRACRAGRLIALVISDVLGDPLDIIASGPTVPDPSTPAIALEILNRYGARQAGVAPRVFEYLERRTLEEKTKPREQTTHCRATNLVIGNNAVAVDAAGVMAEQLGYSHAMIAMCDLEGPAEDVGRHLAQMALEMRGNRGPNCLITGGEPTVKLAPPDRRGRGGRNQQLVLAALEILAASDPSGIAILSGGTDGEDGPTDAAGALVDAPLIAAARARGLNPADYLARNDAYSFFESLDGLIKTGPTHTNVCDVRVVVVDQV
jgi:hydroxypyruvate reductase